MLRVLDSTGNGQAGNAWYLKLKIKFCACVRACVCVWAHAHFYFEFQILCDDEKNKICCS